MHALEEIIDSDSDPDAASDPKHYTYYRTGMNMVAVASGANMEFDRLRFAGERSNENEVSMSLNRLC